MSDKVFRLLIFLCAIFFLFSYWKFNTLEMEIGRYQTTERHLIDTKNGKLYFASDVYHGKGEWKLVVDKPIE